MRRADGYKAHMKKRTPDCLGFPTSSRKLLNQAGESASYPRPVFKEETSVLQDVWGGS